MSLFCVIWFEVVKMLSVIGKLKCFFFLGKLVGVKLIVMCFVGNLKWELMIVLCIWLCDFFIVVFGNFIKVNFGILLLMWILIVIGGVCMLILVWLWMIVSFIVFFSIWLKSF